jgi:hypothetical protein
MGQQRGAVNFQGNPSDWLDTAKVKEPADNSLEERGLNKLL